MTDSDEALRSPVFLSLYLFIKIIYLTLQKLSVLLARLLLLSYRLDMTYCCRRDLVSGSRAFSFRISCIATKGIVEGMEILEENSNLDKVAYKAAKTRLEGTVEKKPINVRYLERQGENRQSEHSFSRIRHEVHCVLFTSTVSLSTLLKGVEEGIYSMKREILRKLNTLLLCLLVGFTLAACGGSGSSDGAQGTLSTSLTDSSTDEYEAIYVTIARVDVHHDNNGSWETVAEPNKTYNLLELVNGVLEPLGIATLDTGHYTQMRLIIGDAKNMQHPHANYLVDSANVIHEMKVPSGTNTGLKIVNGFDINENQTTELVLDFDAMHSVVKAGTSGKYLLKPTVKVLDTADHAMISGTVRDITPVLLGGALVSAQVVDPANVDAKDQVIIAAGTLAAENGEYALFLTPGAYNLVASKTGHLSDCIAVTFTTDNLTSADFDLTAAATDPGTVSGLVSIAGAETDQSVTLDFRKEITCIDASAPTTITVQSINIADGGVYSVDLPAGDYQVVASTFNKGTQTAAVTVATGAATTLDIMF